MNSPQVEKKLTPHEKLKKLSKTDKEKLKKNKKLQEKLNNIGNEEVFTKEVLGFLKKEKTKKSLERIILIKIREEEAARDTTSFQKIDEFLEASMLEAERVWHKVLLSMRYEEFYTMSDDDKIKKFRKEHSKFYDEFTIIGRYMICHQQYSRKAFYKYLIQCRNPVHITKTDRTELFLDFSSSYVMYLWEDYQKGARYSRKDALNIKNQVYQSLKKEFTEFDKMYKEVEKKVKVEDKRNRAQLTRELLERLTTGQQSLEEQEMLKLKETLKDKIYMQRFKKMQKELLKTIQPIKPVIEGFGSNKEAQRHHEFELKQEEARKNFQKVDMD